MRFPLVSGEFYASAGAKSCGTHKPLRFDATGGSRWRHSQDCTLESLGYCHVRRCVDAHTQLPQQA